MIQRPCLDAKGLTAWNEGSARLGVAVGLAVIEELSGIRTDAVDPYQYVASWRGQQLKPAEAEVLNQASELLSGIPTIRHANCDGHNKG